MDDRGVLPLVGNHLASHSIAIPVPSVFFFTIPIKTCHFRRALPIEQPMAFAHYRASTIVIGNAGHLSLSTLLRSTSTPSVL